MKKIQWILAAILFCGLSFSSCSKEDNEIDYPEEEKEDENGIDPEEVYQVNNFNLVPANEGDPEVVAALKTISNVTDIKPFMNKRLGQAYYFNYIQPIDHDNPSLGTYKQQVVFTFAGKEAPVILHTQGYSLYGSFPRITNRLDSIDAPQFVYELSDNPEKKFDVNCVQVEYRYHGFSLPEGQADKQTYLSAKQQSDDLHNIVTDLKKALFSGKWLSTGVSKGGLTTYQYAYYYPNDCDMYVPFVAPLTNQPYDLRVGEYMIQQSVKAYLPQIKQAFQKLVNDQKIFDATRQKMEKDLGKKLKEDEVYTYIVKKSYSALFDKESYGNISAWRKYIPSEESTPAEYADFLTLDKTDERIYDFGYLKASTRAARKDPSSVQDYIDQGSNQYDFSWVMNGKLLPADLKKALQEKMDKAKATKKLELQVKIGEWLKTTKCKMYFVYGGNDPWTGAAIDDPTNANVKKYIVPNGTHNDEMNSYEYFGGKEAQKIYDELISDALKNLGM